MRMIYTKALISRDQMRVWKSFERGGQGLGLIQEKSLAVATSLLQENESVQRRAQPERKSHVV